MKRSALLTFAAILALSGHALQGATIISINLSDTDGDQNMGSSSLAGAPGVRVDDWNNLETVKDAGFTSPSALVYEDGSAVPDTFTVSSVSNANFASASANTNDDLMFTGRTLYRDPNANFTQSGSFTFSAIPFANYDIYIYVNGGDDARGGSISLSGGDTYYVRGNSSPANDGTGYVLATSTSYDPGEPGDVAVANYVKFSGLSGASQTINFSALDMGDTSLRLNVHGFQIVQVPEPGSVALLGLGSIALVGLRRNRK